MLATADKKNTASFLCFFFNVVTYFALLADVATRDVARTFVV